MKQLIKFMFAALAVTAAVSSCKDNEPGNKPEPTDRGVVTLSADKSTIGHNNDEATLTVLYNDEDVTEQATFEVDGNSLETGNKFSSTEVGTYTIIADFDGITSNSITITVENRDPVVLSVDKSIVAVGDRVNFKVTRGSDDLTGSALICEYSDSGEAGVCLMDPYFEPGAQGKYRYYAHFEGSSVETNVVEITAVADLSSVKFQKAVAFFNRTGSWCTWCTPFKVVLKQLNASVGDKMVIVSFQSEENTNALSNTITSTLWSGISGNFDGGLPGGVPSTVIDLYSYISGYDGLAATTAKYNERKDIPAKTGIQVNSGFNGNTVEVDIDILAESAGTYAVGAFLVEDNIIFNQAGNSGTDQGTIPANPNYNHTNVLRGRPSEMTSIFGVDLGAMTAGEVKSKSFSFPATPKIVSNVPIYVHENLSVVVYTTSLDEDGKKYIANIVKVPAAGFTGYKLAQ